MLFRNAEALETLREGRHAGRRQDRHAHRGQAAAGRASSPATGWTRSELAARWPRASSRAASIRWPRRSSPGARERGHRARPARRLQAVTGQGRDAARSMAGRVALGNAALLRGARRRRGRRWPAAPSSCAREGQTVVFVGGRRAGRRAARRRRPDQGDDARGAAARCSAEGLRVVMLTGDSRTTAEAVARRARASTRSIAEVLPEREGARSSRGSSSEGRRRRDGGRRHQRRARAGAGRRRHRDGHRHRRGDGERRRHAREGRPPRHRPGAAAEPRPTMRNIRQNLFFAFVYNALGRADRGGRALSLARACCSSPMIAARGDELQLGLGDRQRAPVEPRRSLTSADGPSWRGRTHRLRSVPASRGRSGSSVAAAASALGPERFVRQRAARRTRRRNTSCSRTPSARHWRSAPASTRRAGGPPPWERPADTTRNRRAMRDGTGPHCMRRRLAIARVAAMTNTDVWISHGHSPAPKPRPPRICRPGATKIRAASATNAGATAGLDSLRKTRHTTSSARATLNAFNAAWPSEPEPRFVEALRPEHHAEVEGDDDDQVGGKRPAEPPALAHDQRGHGHQHDCV